MSLLRGFLEPLFMEGYSVPFAYVQPSQDLRGLVSVPCGPSGYTRAVSTAAFRTRCDIYHREAIEMLEKTVGNI